MRLRYLGTAAAEGWPSLYCRCGACMRARARGGKDIRTRSQAIVDDCLLIDLPADTLHHALSFGVDMAAVEHLLVTHSHLDHFYPYDAHLRSEPYAHECPPLHIYGNEAVRRVYEESLPDYLPDIGERVIFHTVHAFDTLTLGAYTVEPMPAAHRQGEECLIYRIEREGRALLYAHDTGYLPEPAWEHLRGKRLDLVSLDCTYCLMPGTQGHMGLWDNDRVRQRMMEEGMADERTIFIINHFTHNCAEENGHAELAEAAGRLGMLAAYDGMEVFTPLCAK